MSETVNQEQGQTQKTFTQDEVNAIVADRLSRERQKYSDYDALKDKAGKYDAMAEASKSELEKATERAVELQKQLDDMKAADAIRAIKENVSTQTGVPANLLTGSTEEECLAQANAIKAYAAPKYPNLKDAGEVNFSGKQSTRDKFAEWFNGL